MELIEPEISVRRGSFHTRYAIPTDKRDLRNKFPRLLDCLLTIAASDDREYFESPGAGEFAVVDVVTKEKAWFEMPHGATPDNVQAMVEGHFAASAFRVGPKLWFV